MLSHPVFDSCFHLAYRLAYPLACRWWRFRRKSGVAVAIWHGGQILTVLHSYKPGRHLPGGNVEHGEDFRVAAAREVREEVGIDLPPERYELICSVANAAGRIEQFFELRLPTKPVVTVDRREIVSADFTAPEDIIYDRPRYATLTAYLRSGGRSERRTEGDRHHLVRYADRVS